MYLGRVLGVPRVTVLPRILRLSRYLPPVALRPAPHAGALSALFAHRTGRGRGRGQRRVEDMYGFKSAAGVDGIGPKCVPPQLSVDA